ncbi:MAG: ribosome biogenesis GTP-binding protein YihA/YsxC [Bacilli bacterium]|nr:ribosome biogenesis GTP-binding protein YihA/YsxC [Bacilli bacterium]
MINFRNTSFEKSVSKYIEAPKGNFPEVLFVGRSNVGKSSLINALTNNKSLAFTSKKPGHTQLLNFYNVNNQLYLVDAPGYGYAISGIDLDMLFKNMMDDYFTSSRNLKLVLALFDSRRELREDDVDLINYFIDKKINFQIIITKVDKLNQSEKSSLLKQLSSLRLKKEEVILYSNQDKNSINLIINAIQNNL